MCGLDARHPISASDELKRASGTVGGDQTMLLTEPKFCNFEEYLAYEDGGDRLYELFNGVLIEVPPESGLTVQIVNRLFLQIALLIGTDLVGHLL